MTFGGLRVGLHVGVTSYCGGVLVSLGVAVCSVGGWAGDVACAGMLGGGAGGATCLSIEFRHIWIAFDTAQSEAVAASSRTRSLRACMAVSWSTSVVFGRSVRLGDCAIFGFMGEVLSVLGVLRSLVTRFR